MNINEWIDLRLKELNLTTTQLIERSKVSKATVYRLKSQKVGRTPNSQTMKRLESVLGGYEKTSGSAKKYKLHESEAVWEKVCKECGNRTKWYLTSNHVDKQLVNAINGDSYEQFHKKLKRVGFRLCLTCDEEKFSILNLTYPDLIEKLIVEYQIPQIILSRIVGLSGSMVTRLKNKEVTFVDGEAAHQIHELAFSAVTPKNIGNLSLSTTNQDTMFFYRVLAKFGYNHIDSKIDKLAFAHLGSAEEIEDKIKNDFDNLQPDLKLISRKPAHLGGGDTSCFVLTYYDEKIPELFKTLASRLNCRYVCFVFPVGFQSYFKVPKGYKCFEHIKGKRSTPEGRMNECEITYERLPSNPHFRWRLNLNNI